MELKTPIEEEDIEDLRTGQEIELSGTIFTARDAAHEKILGTKELPINLDKSAIYHCGPLVKKKDDNWQVVSAGPTTSTRLSSYIPELLDRYNIRAIIGKGGFKKEVIPSLEKNKCIYLAYTGGAAALAAESIKEVKEVYWKELGMPEAIWELAIKELPCTVAIDTKGNTLYRD